MKELTIESQYNYDYTKQWIPEIDEEILTVQNDSISIREMLMRDMAGTLDARFDSGFYDYDDEEDPDFEGSEFYEIRDMDDIQFFREYLDVKEKMFLTETRKTESIELSHDEEKTGVTDTTD